MAEIDAGIFRGKNNRPLVGSKLMFYTSLTSFLRACLNFSGLTTTKLEYYVANTTSEVAATSLPDETGILPDHYVTQSIDDYLNKVDAMKAYTLQLINQ